MVISTDTIINNYLTNLLPSDVSRSTYIEAYHLYAGKYWLSNFPENNKHSDSQVVFIDIIQLVLVRCFTMHDAWI